MEEDKEMTPVSHSQESPSTNTLQWRQQQQQQQQQQQRRQNEDEDEQHMDDQLQPAENCPTHHPSAPPGELFDVETTIDPGYIISFLRKLVPVNERQGDVLQGFDGLRNSTQMSDADHMFDAASSPKRSGGLNSSNGNIEMMETQTVQSSRLAGADDNEIDPLNKSSREETWEESGCVLWDLAANKEHAEFMAQNLVLEVLLANLMTSDSARITEISLGVIGNLACHDVLMNQITSTNKLLETIVDQVFTDDAPCLCEVCRVLTLGLQGCQRVVWARAMQSDHILSRVLWIVENTLNPVLIEKSVGLLLAIMENQQDVISILLQPLMNLGLSNLLVNLLASEMVKLTSERTPERYPVLDSILRAIEALSVTDGYSEGICSNKEVVQMAIELIKIPEKIEISSSCVTAAVLIANILTDTPDLARRLSEDFLMLQCLLDLFPFTSEDFEARNALWSIVTRLLVPVQAEMSPSRLSQYVLMLVDRSDMIEDTLLASEWDRSPEHDNLTSSKVDCRAAAIKCIVKILCQWNLVKEEVFTAHNDAETQGICFPEDRDVQKLLDCCLKHAN